MDMTVMLRRGALALGLIAMAAPMAEAQTPAPQSQIACVGGTRDLGSPVQDAGERGGVVPFAGRKFAVDVRSCAREGFEGAGEFASGQAGGQGKGGQQQQAGPTQRRSFLAPLAAVPVGLGAAALNPSSLSASLAFRSHSVPL